MDAPSTRGSIHPGKWNLKSVEVRPKGERFFCSMLQAELENQCQLIEGRTKLTAVPGDPFPLGLLPEGDCSLLSRFEPLFYGDNYRVVLRASDHELDVGRIELAKDRWRKDRHVVFQTQVIEMGLQALLLRHLV
ncbi:hypothetical protein Q3G72_014580 [Acer saccharum]|nr:hypothetical protein Q3G72_014580 [Acer saccharum]